MKAYVRILVMASLVLLAFFSLPFWLPSALAAFSTPSAAADVQTSSELSKADLPAAIQPVALDAIQPSPLLAGASPLLLWSNNWQEANSVESSDPKLVAWSPGSGEVLWSLDTGFAYGALADPANGLLYFLEEPLRETGEPAKPLQLGVAELASGELLSRTPLTERFFANLNSGAPRPILLLGETLYFTNYGSRNNLAAYDLSSATLPEERYDLCETGYPIQWAYSRELNAFATLCIDFSSSQMAGSLTRLSLADGSLRSLDLPQFGSEEYMGGNGLALGANGLAYVVDSEANQIVEIELASMHITRQVSYAPIESAQSLWQRAVAWLLHQAASPVAAKRMFAVSAISPDGSQLAVGGGYFSAQAHTIYLIDLETLQAGQQFRIGDTPGQLSFAGDGVLLALYEAVETGRLGRGMAIELASGQQDLIELPFTDYLSQLIAIH